MKKSLKVRKLERMSGLEKNSQIVLARSGAGWWMQNLHTDSGIKVTVDEQTKEISLSFVLQEGEFLVMEDVPGVAKKQEYDTKTRKWKDL